MKMALAIVLMVIFTLTWAESAFHLTQVILPDYAIGILVFSLFWALLYDLKGK